MIRAGVLAVLLCACGGGGGRSDAGIVDLGMADGTVIAGDSDADGLTDAEEARLLAAYLPFLSLASDDACATSGLVARVTPYERQPLVVLRLAWLFDRDCWMNDRAGSGGVFVVLVDPYVPAPEGMKMLRGVARRDTACQRVSTCGRCTGQLTCETLGGRPAVWASRDAHAIYVDRPRSCTQIGACRAECVDATASAAPPVVEIGEPAAPRVRDLTDEGFIRPELGWQSASLMHHDPWGGAPFGALPSIRALLTDGVSDASCEAD